MENGYSGAEGKFASAGPYQKKRAKTFQRASGDNEKRLPKRSGGVRQGFGGSKKKWDG